MLYCICIKGGAVLPIVYKVDILAALKQKGISAYRMRKNKIMGEATIQQLRENQLTSWETMSKICGMLDCQPGDLLEYVPEPTTTDDKEVTLNEQP